MLEARGMAEPIRIYRSPILPDDGFVHGFPERDRRGVDRAARVAQPGRPLGRRPGGRRGEPAAAGRSRRLRPGAAPGRPSTSTAPRCGRSASRCRSRPSSTGWSAIARGRCWARSRRTASRSCSPTRWPEVAGACHAGWRGTVAGVAANVDRADGRARREAGRHPGRAGPLDRAVLLRGRARGGRRRFATRFGGAARAGRRRAGEGPHRPQGGDPRGARGGGGRGRARRRRACRARSARRTGSSRTAATAGRAASTWASSRSGRAAGRRRTARRGRRRGRRGVVRSVGWRRARARAAADARGPFGSAPWGVRSPGLLSFEGSPCPRPGERLCSHHR